MGWAVNTKLRPFRPPERPGTRCVGGWVGTGLEGCVKYRSHWDWIPGPSSQERLAIPTALWHTPWCIGYEASTEKSKRRQANGFVIPQ